MAVTSLINNNDKIYAECIENLIKAEALIDFALHSDISDVSLHTLHDVLWAISDFIKNAKQANEALSPK
jgi:hypothetical protein